MLRLDLLNEPQHEAVVHGDGPLVVFAGAGSGKTRVITYRVARLIEQGMRPWRVLAVTFTNKAAGEMRERITRLLPSASDGLQVGTFHANCARLLRRYGEQAGVSRDFTIYDDQDQKAALKRITKDLALDEKRYSPKMLANQINRAKQELITADKFEVEDAWSDVVRKVYATYERQLAQANALDFGDLIHRLVCAMQDDATLCEELAGRFSHVLVDEFQDTNRAQFRLVQLLAEGHRNLCVVGDDDQSIYRWRGADRRNILDFRESFPDAHIVKLEQNYRSTQRILRAANTVIAHNIDREPKTLWTDNQEGEPVLIVQTSDERDEARMVLRAIGELLEQGRALTECVVFYRTHAQSRILEEGLRAADIPYRIVGGMRFYDRAEIKDALAYLRVIANPDDDVSLLRIINTPTRGIGKSTIDRLLERASLEQGSVWQAIASALEHNDLTPKAAKRIREFIALIRDMQDQVAKDCPLDEVGAQLLERSGYVAMLKRDDSVEADARVENLQELVGSMREFGERTLNEFLADVTLQTSADEAHDGDFVTLMTVHAAKGLEFPVVFVTGLEEKLFPSRGVEAWDDGEELEEERRLAYVAFTRAKERLVLSYASVRRIFGQQRVGIPSRFLSELPAADTQWIGQPKKQSRPSAPSYSTPQGSYIDRSEVYDDGGEMVRAGMRVRHAKFGIGEIRDVLDGSPSRVNVNFPGHGTRKILLSYLEPA